MPNRQIAPQIHDISKLDLPPFRVHTLDNGIPVHLIELGTQELLKIEIIFNAGRPYEQKQLVARATSRLLKEGTRQFDSAAIAEQVDFLRSNPKCSRQSRLLLCRALLFDPSF